MNNIEKQLKEILRDLEENSKDLPEDIKDILYEDLWNLYEEGFTNSLNCPIGKGSELLEKADKLIKKYEDKDYGRD